MKPHEGLGKNKLHIDLLNFNYQLATTLFPLTNSLCGKKGHYLFLLFGLAECFVSISNGNRIGWSPVRSNDTSD